MKTALRRLWTLILKEFMLILRDPKSRMVVISPPILQFFLFGYAATFDVSHVRYAYLDESRSAASRTLLAAFDGSDAFELTDVLQSPQQFDAMIDARKVALIIHIGQSFERDLAAGRPAQVQIIGDGRNSNVATVAIGYAGEIVEAFNRDPWGASAMPETVRLVDRAWYNSNLLSRWFIVSALAATIGMVIVLLLASLSVAREREFGTFDQLMVAPFRPWEILVGKSVPGIAFGLLDGLLLSLGAIYWFDVPFRGTFMALVPALLVFFVSIVGVGLLISSLSLTMQQGLLGAFTFIMPSVILSGFATPVSNMPEWLQTVTLVNPLRYAVHALRDIFLQGADLPQVWPQIWPMILIACVTLPLAAWMFRNRTE
ncbi:ABC transporter permease [Ruficoccus sp. ZRK36]|uniref:ABC transporter permease n=1 Tax=Ruficoccus sp. ZRK36 TaxID=2866311 RepID=UPI001C72C1F5|nr:ABC transporter permease [Ruficoccus sp. ZRK36]QYY35074.1 ABC transporter permease [Ruficoccus sp. ZRK36]